MDDFYFFKESSTCTDVTFLIADGGAALKIEIGFSLLIQFVARAVAPWTADGGVFSALTRGNGIIFLAGAKVFSSGSFGNSVCVASADEFVNGFFVETNCGR